MFAVTDYTSNPGLAQAMDYLQNKVCNHIVYLNKGSLLIRNYVFMVLCVCVCVCIVYCMYGCVVCLFMVSMAVLYVCECGAKSLNVTKYLIQSSFLH